VTAAPHGYSLPFDTGLVQLDGVSREQVVAAADVLRRGDPGEACRAQLARLVQSVQVAIDLGARPPVVPWVWQAYAAAVRALVEAPVAASPTPPLMSDADVRDVVDRYAASEVVVGQLVSAAARRLETHGDAGLAVHLLAAWVAYTSGVAADMAAQDAGACGG
jgi:hypothetical protein